MRAVVVRVAPDELELAADALWAKGVVAIEERAGDDEAVELWTSLGDDAPNVIEALGDLPWAWRFEEVDESVSETWRDHAQPIWVAPDLVVHPAWVVPEHVGDVIAIGIEPGATFGLGDHPTTVLSMLAMRDVLRDRATVLDVGCGSGVLAIAACRFGAASAVAIDISAAAVPTTTANATSNGVAALIDVSTTPLAEVDGPFDVVVANILAPALIDLAADLIRVVRPGGHLVISGVLAERHQHVLDALAPLTVVGQRDRDGWTAITLRG